MVERAAAPPGSLPPEPPHRKRTASHGPASQYQQVTGRGVLDGRVALLQDLGERADREQPDGG